MRYYNKNDDHEDVQQELYEIIKHKKKFERVFLFVWLIIFFVNALFLSAILWIVLWLFDSINFLATVSVVCTSYISSALILAILRAYQRIERMEMHALTIQNEVLKIKELIEEGRRRSWFTHAYAVSI